MRAYRLPMLAEAISTALEIGSCSAFSALSAAMTFRVTEVYLFRFRYEFPCDDYTKLMPDKIAIGKGFRFICGEA
jgi:hypothetical protein